MQKEKQPPSIWKIVVIGISALLVVFVAVFFGIARSSMSNLLLQSEEKYVREQLRAVEGLLETSMTDIYHIAYDVATRERTISYIETAEKEMPLPDFFEESVLGTYALDFVLIKARDGQDVYAEFAGRPAAPGTIVPEPQEFSQALIARSSRILDRYSGAWETPDTIEEYGEYGIWFYNDIPYSLACVPILDLTESREPVGSVIIGSRLDDGYFHQVLHYNTMSFRIFPAEKQAENAEPDIDRQNPEVLQTKMMLHDMDGNPVVLLMNDNRDAYTAGRKIIFQSTLLLVLVVAVFTLGIYVLIAGQILRPLKRLSVDIANLVSGSVDQEKYPRTAEFSRLCTAINQMLDRIQKSQISLQVFQDILNELDAYIYLTDPETDEILFIDDTMAEIYDVKGKDLSGRPCWEVLTGAKERCGFCPLDKLIENPESTYTWEHFSHVTGRYYRNSDWLVQWTDQRRVHLQQGIEITESKLAEAALQKRLDQQKKMSAIARCFISTDDLPVMLESALEIVGEFMGASCIAVFRREPGDESNVLVLQQGWFNRSHGYRELGELGTYERVSYAPGSDLYNIFIRDEKPYVAIHNTADTGSGFAQLAQYDVRAFILAPIYMGSEFSGFIAVSNSLYDSVWDESDIYLVQHLSSITSELFIRDKTQKELLRAKEVAEESNRAKSDFLSRMSHEMRTPMNAIIGMTTIALSSDNTNRKNYCLGIIENAAHHLLGVINDILDMSKIESQKFSLNYSDFSFESMLIQAVNVVNFRIGEKNQNLVVKIDADVPVSIVSDERRLVQVITNLLFNASKFTPEGGTITVLVSLVEKKENGVCILQLEVQDTGIGISEDQQERIFHSFEQADGGISRKYGGTGLGLVISKNIVEMLGGSIWIESELDVGSSFIFQIQATCGSQTAASDSAQQVEWKNLHLLVVDRSEDVRIFFQELAGALGFSCSLAEGLDDTLEILAQGECDIVFLDWNISKENDAAFARRLKDVWDGAVVIMISTKEWAAIDEETMETRADQYVFKPLFPSQVSDAVTKSVNTHRREKQIALPAPELEPEPEPAADTEGQFVGKRVLLAEDVEINKEILVALLESTGLTIDWAENGRIAFEMFQNNPDAYDLIFMDIHMPEVDGYETTRMIREMDHPWAKEIPIIAMTANVFREDVEKCLACGMDAHIGKPLDMAEVFRQLQKHLR